MAACVIGLVLGLLAVLLLIRSRQSPVYVAAVITPSFVSLAAGLIAWRRRPGNSTGRLLMAVGFVMNIAITSLYSKIGPLVAFGHVIAGSGEIVIAYLLLVYPWGRLTARFDRWAIGVAVIIFFGFGTASVLATGTCPYCSDVNSGSAATSFLQRVEAAGYAIAIAIVLIRIFRRYFVASPPARRVLTPVLFGGAVFALVLAWREIGPQLLGLHSYASVALSASDAAEALIPLGLLLGFLRLRLERASVGALAADLTLGRAVREQLQDALAKRLGDPGLRVGFWSPAAMAYLDRDGLILDLDRLDVARTVKLLDRNGKPDVAIVCDAALAEDPGLLDQVAAVVRLAVANISAELPVGTVTFLSTDIEKSTELLGRLRERYAAVLSEHRQLLRHIVSRQDGYVVDSRADEFFAVFTQPIKAVGAAVEAQRELARDPWAHSLAVKVRMGIHSGRPELLDGGYVGLDVHHAVRVSAEAHGGQILLSEAARSSLGDADLGDLGIRVLGEHHLKGFPAPEILYELLWDTGRHSVTQGIASVAGG